MKNGWLKKIGLGLVLTLALGTAACGGIQDFDEAGLEDFINQGDTDSDEGGVVFFEGGSITDTGDGLSASFNTGESVSFDD
jgi:hypothetical protein